MNSAKRLQKILSDIVGYKTQNQQLVLMYQDLFKLDSIFEVYSFIIELNKELERYKEEVNIIGMGKSAQSEINQIENLLKAPNLQQQVTTLSPTLKISVIPMLERMSEMIETEAMAEKHQLNEDELDLKEFIKNLADLLKDVSKSDLDDVNKAIFISFIADLQKGTMLYEIHGIDAIIKTMQDNLCKYKNIEPALKGKYEKFKDGATNIIRLVA